MSICNGFWRDRIAATAVAVTVACCGLAGCRSNPTPASQEASSSRPASDAPAAPAAQPAPNPATLGDVTGVVRFAGKPPAPIRIDTSMDPACSLAATGDVFTEQYAVKGDRMANVYIYIKSGPALLSAAPASKQPVVLDQKGCVYVPHVIAVQVGQPVEFRNSDPTMHNIHTMPDLDGNPELDMSEGPRGKPQTRSFAKPEVMMPVRCNNHPWMNAFINISATPWFAVTAADGKFDLKGLPAGDYTIGAVQEKLGEQYVKVTVKPQAATQADFTFAMK